MTLTILLVHVCVVLLLCGIGSFHCRLGWWKILSHATQRYEYMVDPHHTIGSKISDFHVGHSVLEAQISVRVKVSEGVAQNWRGVQQDRVLVHFTEPLLRIDFLRPPFLQSVHDRFVLFLLHS